MTPSTTPAARAKADAFRAILIDQVEERTARAPVVVATLYDVNDLRTHSRAYRLAMVQA